MVSSGDAQDAALECGLSVVSSLNFQDVALEMWLFSSQQFGFSRCRAIKVCARNVAF